MRELTDTELKEVEGGASNATTFVGSVGGVVVKIHHSSPESMENGAINNMNHVIQKS